MWQSATTGEKQVLSINVFVLFNPVNIPATNTGISSPVFLSTYKLSVSRFVNHLVFTQEISPQKSRLKQSHGPLRLDECTKAGMNRFFPKYRINLKTLGARTVTCSNFHAEDPQMLGDIVQKFVAMATWRPEFVGSYTKRFKGERDQITLSYSSPFLII